jgi:hypothetical protein
MMIALAVLAYLAIGVQVAERIDHYHPRDLMEPGPRFTCLVLWLPALAWTAIKIGVYKA